MRTPTTCAGCTHHEWWHTTPGALHCCTFGGGRFRAMYTAGNLAAPPACEHWTDEPSDDERAVMAAIAKLRGDP